jgi:NADPH:quinone reductase-like Zn-dependent oxidoreductase
MAHVVQYIARKPDGVSWEEAAGAPLVSLTAYQCCEAADVRPGTRVPTMTVNANVNVPFNVNANVLLHLL